QACQARLDSAGVAFETVREDIELDMLYAGQSHTVSVALTRSTLARVAIAAACDAAYRRAYGRVLAGVAVRVRSRRHGRIGGRPKCARAGRGPTGKPMPAPRGTEAVYHGGRWWDAVRYGRPDLPAGAAVAGPAVFEQPDTTSWLEPGFTARVDTLGNLLITPAMQEQPCT